MSRRVQDFDLDRGFYSLDPIISPASAGLFFSADVGRLIVMTDTPQTDATEPNVDPEPESLRMLYEADVRHIAEMKARQWSVLKWTVGLTVAYVGVFISGIGNKPIALGQSLSVIIFLIAVASAYFIARTHWSMRRKRDRLWRVYDALNLTQIVGGNARRDRHTSRRYDFWIWGPMTAICVGSAIVAAWIGLPLFR